MHSFDFLNKIVQKSRLNIINEKYNLEKTFETQNKQFFNQVAANLGQIG